MTSRIPTAGQVCGTLALAAFFWWVNFGLHWVNFWIGMGTAASVLALLSFCFGGAPLCDLRARQYAFRLAVPLCAASGIGHLRYPP